MHARHEHERLADHLQRVDLAHRGAVVAVVHLAQLDPQLVLLLLVEPHAEVVQPPRQRVHVLVHRVEQEPRQPAHVGLAERPGHAEVDQPQAAVGEHHDVRGMGVAVEHPVAEDHLEPRLGDQDREPAALVHRRRREIEVAELDALEPLERQHPLAGVGAVHARDGHARLLGEVAAEDLGVAGLGAVVELVPDRAGELVHDGHRVDERQPVDAAAHDPRDLVEQAQVGLDLAGGVRPLHLDRHPAPVRQLGEVHLADRRRRDRHRVEVRRTGGRSATAARSRRPARSRCTAPARPSPAAGATRTRSRAGRCRDGSRAAARTSRTSARARPASRAGAARAPAGSAPR